MHWSSRSGRSTTTTLATVQRNPLGQRWQSGHRPDANWTSYITTPPYRTTSAASQHIGAANEVLRNTSGPMMCPSTYTATGLPPAVTRSYARLSEAADESASATRVRRHTFRTGCQQRYNWARKSGGRFPHAIAQGTEQ